MAKLSGPLLSFGASGSLADSVTFTKRKRQHVAKAYAVPANPNSSAQVSQRSIISAANSAINAARTAVSDPFNDDDIAALELLSRTMGKKSTWYNRAVSLFSVVAAAGYVGCVIRGGTFYDSAGTWRLKVFCDEIDGVNLTSGHLYYGRSPAVLTRSSNFSFNPAFEVASAPLNGAASGETWYARFISDIGGNCFGASSGIYKTVVS